MADPVDMIVPLLRDMRAENAALHEETRGLIKILEKRLGAIEGAQNSYRQALTADTLPSKLITGEFEERIGALELKMRELESQK
jgi:hypothetical protein